MSENIEPGDVVAENGPTEDGREVLPRTQRESHAQALFSRFSSRFHPHAEFSPGSKPAPSSDKPVASGPSIQAVEDVQPGSKRKEDEKTWELKNQVPQTVEISSNGAKPPKRIPPFGSLVIKESELGNYPLEEWISKGVLEITETVDPEPPAEQILLLIWAGGLFYSGFFWIIAWGIGKFTYGPPPDSWWLWTAGLAAAASIGYLNWRFFSRGAWRSTLKNMRHSIGGVVQLGIAFGIPAITVFAAQYAAPPNVAAKEAIFDVTLFGPKLFSFDVLQVAPALQVLMIGVLSGLPALLFYLFDRQKLSTLSEEFFRSVVILVPSIHTLRDAESVFGLRAQAVLGNTRSSVKAGRYLPHNRSVIFVTTVIVTIGWVVTLANDTEKAGWPLVQYFMPTADPLVYAFLGAYTFGLGMLFRRYTRSDIKPSAYAHFTVRTVTAVIIAWVFTLMLPDSGENVAILVTAFVIGFFPDTGLAAIFEFVKNREVIKTNIPSFTEKFALERLDGINIYHRARLIDEGIENMENLAHAELIELMLQTRIPLATLIDWIDQSILFLHVGSRDSSDDKAMNVLRRHGIRTASDLEKARDAAKERDKANGGGDAELSHFLAILNPGKSVRRLETALDALEDDEWMENIRVWRNTRFPTDVLSDPSRLA